MNKTQQILKMSDLLCPYKCTYAPCFIIYIDTCGSLKRVVLLCNRRECHQLQQISLIFPSAAKSLFPSTSWATYNPGKQLFKIWFLKISNQSSGESKTYRKCFVVPFIQRRKSLYLNVFLFFRQGCQMFFFGRQKGNQNAKKHSKKLNYRLFLRFATGSSYVLLMLYN